MGRGGIISRSQRFRALGTATSILLWCRRLSPEGDVNSDCVGELSPPEFPDPCCDSVLGAYIPKVEPTVKSL